MVISNQTSNDLALLGKVIVYETYDAKFYSVKTIRLLIKINNSIKYSTSFKVHNKVTQQVFPMSFGIF